MVKTMDKNDESFKSGYLLIVFSKLSSGKLKEISSFYSLLDSIYFCPKTKAKKK